jgi:hypothetical protein
MRVAGSGQAVGLGQGGMFGGEKPKCHKSRWQAGWKLAFCLLGWPCDQLPAPRFPPWCRMSGRRAGVGIGPAPCARPARGARRVAHASRSRRRGDRSLAMNTPGLWFPPWWPVSGRRRAGVGIVAAPLTRPAPRCPPWCACQAAPLAWGSVPRRAHARPEVPALVARVRRARWRGDRCRAMDPPGPEVSALMAAPW